MRITLFALIPILLIPVDAVPAPSRKWTEQKANQWYQNQPWLLLTSAQSINTNGAPSAKDAKRLARFEEQLEQLRSLLRIPGLSAVIIKDNKVLWVKGFGYADVEEQIPATPNTLYHIASLTKTFAATILMQLVEQGKLDLDEPMSKYSDEIKDEAVKVKHILSHTSNGAPGEQYWYDGARYSLLTAVIEKKTGKPFRVLLAEMFLDRLKMSGSVPSRDVLTEANKQSIVFGKDRLAHYQTILKKSAQCYRLYGDETVRTAYGWSSVSATAGLLSTAVDMAKFDIAVDGHLYLKKETQELSWTPFVSNNGKPLPHGLGWFVQNYQGEKIIWHFGFDPYSFSSTYVKVPEKGLSLVLLANSDALSAPFVRRGVIESSPFVISFLRIFVFEDSQSHTLPDPNWGQSDESFSNGLARLRKPGDGYSYDGELKAYQTMMSWLETRRKQAHKPVRTDPRTFQIYVGEYQLPDGLILTVTKEGEKLMMDLPGYIKSELYLNADMKFFLKTFDGDIAFIKNENGKITHFKLHQGGQITVVKRIK